MDNDFIARGQSEPETLPPGCRTVLRTSAYSATTQPTWPRRAENRTRAPRDSRAGQPRTGERLADHPSADCFVTRVPACNVARAGLRRVTSTTQRRRRRWRPGPRGRMRQDRCLTRSQRPWAPHVPATRSRARREHRLDTAAIVARCSVGSETTTAVNLWVHGRNRGPAAS